jgi:signal transduction histidine kinase
MHLIFQRQFRTENAIKFKCDGDGLGLYIVKSMMDKTNAKISLTSKLNKGTTFKVAFPVSRNRSYKHLL